MPAIDEQFRKMIFKKGRKFFCSLNRVKCFFAEQARFTYCLQWVARTRAKKMWKIECRERAFFIQEVVDDVWLWKCLTIVWIVVSSSWREIEFMKIRKTFRRNSRHFIKSHIYLVNPSIQSMISTKLFPIFCFRLRFSFAEREGFTLFRQEVRWRRSVLGNFLSFIYLPSVTLKLSQSRLRNFCL